ncbi:MAG TPA: alpha/beta hydrolase [Candidatus Polarisedimenticolaceae bacterium]|nr:alpha/beta hydrolase [Candidatus Polarisedimenticolaceae bacterium]
MRLTVLPGGDGPWVVQLAGIVGGCLLYREAGEALVRAGYRVALLDTAGDRRDDPTKERLSWDFLAREVVAGLDALGAERPLLYGTSFGSLVALATAARFPERVSGLLLAHPPRHGRKLFLPAVRWAVRQKDPVRTTARLFQLIFTGLVCWEFAYPAALRRIPMASAAATAAATPAKTLHDKLSLLWSDAPGLPPPGLPVSIISSPWDAAAPLAGARAWQQEIPGAALRVLRFTGHSAHYSRPRAFHRLVVEEVERMWGDRHR